MASPLTEAYTQLLVAQVDPMNGVIKSMASQQIATSQLSLDEGRLQMFTRLSEMITAEKAGANDGNTVAALVRMQSKYADLIGAVNN